MGCPSPDCGGRIVFDAGNLPPAFDSIKVEVYDLQGNLVFFEKEALDTSGWNSYAYDSEVKANLKMSIHCASGWQSFRAIEAVPKDRSSNLVKWIEFSYDGTATWRDSKRIPAEQDGDICEIDTNAVFIIGTTSCAPM